MKNFIVLPLALIIITFTQLLAQSPKPRILGVVMGISKYQNVPSLKYADRDAMSFYNFLLSPAGGKANTNNIRLLLNEKATSYNFFEAMDNLLDMAKEGDQVYIYFAGHGDIEKKTERQNGFLIGYNAPATCYAGGGAISVRFLQDYVETLVSKNKSKVILIVDACRSGKLAGGREGAEITALSLKQEWKGITKILSCQPGETSLEGDNWGGGAGVFTYFMLRGLKGEADEDNDGDVSLRELSYFLDKTVPKETGNKQLPEVVGDKRLEICSVDRETFLAMQRTKEIKEDYEIKKTSAGFESDVTEIKDISVLQNYLKFKEHINNNNLIDYDEVGAGSPSPNKETALSIYRSLESKREASPLLNGMKRELLAALQNKAQIIMNGVINGIKPEKGNMDSAYKELAVAYNIADTANLQYKQVKYKYLFWSHFNKDDSLKIRILEECIKTNPDEPYTYFSLGYYLNQMGQYDKAILNYDKAIELSRNWSWAWHNKGSAIRGLGKNEEAIKCYEEAIKLKPDCYEAWINKGYALADLGKYESAIKCYDSAIKIKHDYYEAWNNKGGALYNSGKYESAIKFFDKAIEIKPNRFEAWSYKGNALYNLGKYESAIKCYEEAIKIKPDYAEAWNNKGNALGILGKYESAIKCYEEAIKIKPDYAEAWNYKGLALSYLGKNEEAIKCLDRAIEIKYDYLDAWGNKGAALYNLGKNEEAIKCYDKVIELNSKLAIAWSGKGSSLLFMGKDEEATKCFKKAIELNPNDFVTCYDIACAYSKMKNKAKMLELLKKAIELYPQFKDNAPKDEDFKEYWNDPEFLELVK